MDCKDSDDFANTTASSAYKSMKKRICSTVKMFSRSELILSTISFMNIMNMSGELGSPCFRPICELKKQDRIDLYLMHDLTSVYTDFTACTNLLLTFS